VTANPPIDGVLERLREVPDRQAVLGQHGLGRRTPDPGLEDRGHRVRVHVEQPVEPAQVQRDHAGVAVATGREPADDRGPATEGDECDVSLHAPVDDRLHLVVAAGTDDGVRRLGAVALPQQQQVGRRLAPGAQHASVVVGQHVVRADQRLELGHERGVQRVAEPHVGEVDGRGVRRADEGVDERPRGLRKRPGLLGVAPARPVHLSVHMLQCDI
jgi:hypothetical protein